MESEHKAPILGGLRIHRRNTRDALTHGLQDLIEAPPMGVVEILSHLSNVLSHGRQMLGVACFGARSRIRNVEVGNVPVVDQGSELRDHAEVLELAQPLDRKRGGIVELVLRSLLFHAGLAVHRFVRNRRAVAFGEIDKVPRPPRARTSLVAQHLVGDDDAPPAWRDFQNVGGEPPGGLSELHREPYRAFVTAADQLPEAAAFSHCGRHVLGERVLEEGKHVEQRRLARSIRADDHHQLRQLGEPHIFQRTVVLDPEFLDWHGGS